MTRTESRRIPPYQVLLFVAAASVFAAGCGDTSPGDDGGAGDGGTEDGGTGDGGGSKVIPSALGRYVTSGSADDADPANGPPVVYTDPTRMAADNQTLAVSDPMAFNRLGATAEARLGPNPTALAVAVATNKAYSDVFVVTQAQSCSFTLVSTANVTSMSGTATLQVVARILTDAEAVVPGSDFQLQFAFGPGPNNQIAVSVNGVATGTVANPGVYQDDTTGPPGGFMLQPGKYKMLFELNAQATADGIELLKAISSVELK